MYKAFTDEKIVGLIREGDRYGTDFLLQKYAPLIWRQAHQYFSRGFDKDDLFQEGSMAFVRAIQTYEPGNGALFSTYAQNCVRNAVIHTIRREIRNEAPVTPVDPDVFFNQTGYSYMPDFKVDRDGDGPDVIREVFQEEELLTGLEKGCLKDYLKGHNYEEIAKRQGVTTKSVGNALTRCRKKMKQMCKDRGYRFQNGTVY